ncbi:MAG: hypothetical protein QOJ85_540 [Solirubrobacteraceae bacterium]|jgi:uncharacterized protein (DUF2267 family)|nr:hypothetical protein [Solirubrobacteraceae bacterium]
MDYERFIRIVHRAGGIPQGEARRAARATLETLGERLDEDDATELAAKLPGELATWLVTARAREEELDLDEFLRRTAEREGVDAETARRDAAAVFAALADAVGLEQLTEIVAALPADYDELLPPGDSSSVARTERFLRRVYEHAPVPDETAARRAAEAVLETLGERIAAGEVEDLLARLPVELHAPLRRGSRNGGGKAEQMTLVEFLERIADREGVTLDEARDHARAVFLALRDLVGDDELFDVVVELPSDYVETLSA